MNFEPLGRCPVCSADRLQNTAVADLWRCCGCSVVMRNPQPTDAAIRDHDNRGVGLQRMTARRMLVTSNWRERLAIIRRHRQQGRLLDIGTGDGEFALRAREAGFRVVATEVSATAAALAASRGVDVRCAPIAEADLDAQSFEVVTLWHVLEHLRRPAAALAEVRRLLAPGGILVVAVPNESLLLARIRGRLGTFPALPELAARGDELHLLHFTPATLTATLAGAGLELVEFGVDNATPGFTWRSATARFAQQMLSALTGWHFAPAMYVVARKKEQSADPVATSVPDESRWWRRLRAYCYALRSTAKAVRQLRPIVMEGNGWLHFPLATGAWLAQTVTEWGIAVLLVVFMQALGLVPSSREPTWLPTIITDRGVPGIWGALLTLAVAQSALQLVSFGSRGLFSQGIEARLRMVLAHAALMRGTLPPSLSRMNYLTGEAFPRAASFFYHLAQVSCVALQAIALGAAMLYVDPPGAIVALFCIGVFGILVLWFNQLNSRASSQLPGAQASFEQSKVRLSRNWLFIRALRLERHEYASQLEASALIYRHNLVAYFFANLGGMLGPVFGVFLVATIVFVHTALRASPVATLVPFFYLLFRFQQLLANGSHLIGGLFTYRIHLLEAARFVASTSPSDRAEALRVAAAFRAFAPAPTIRDLLGDDDRPHGSRPERYRPPALAVRGLSFRWPGADQPTLSSISVGLPPGRQLAIVGENGTGKSTLLALLLGALSPSEGEIELDGVDSCRWVSSHRGATAFVGSEPYLIGGSLRENLVYGLGRPTTDEAAWQALDQVGLASRVRSLREGLDYVVAEDGGGLSAGEQQKLALARALLSDPCLFLLDEPTAHIDQGSDREIGEALRSLRGRCTVIIVSHRPSVLRHADRILRLERRPDSAPHDPSDAREHL